MDPDHGLDCELMGTWLAGLLAILLENTVDLLLAILDREIEQDLPRKLIGLQNYNPGLSSSHN